MRIFVAIDIPGAVRSALAEFVARLRPASASVRWVRIEGMHVTLKFLGEVPSEKIPAIRLALSTFEPQPSFELEFRNVRFFPGEHRPRVLWVGVEATPALSPLVVAIEKCLKPLGFESERRAFTPHLTLARMENARDLAKLRAAIAAAGSLEFGRTHATEFHLFESVLKRGGAEYTRLATFSLSGSAKQ